LTAPIETALGFSLRCTACPSCCKSVRVPLTHFDVDRLAQVTGRRPHELVEWLSADVIDMTGEPESFVVLREGRRLMTLPHRNGACEWLGSDGLCSVYPARPAPCAAYPYALHGTGVDRRLAVLEDAPCAVSRGVAASPSSDGSRTLEAAERVQRELDAFVGLVALWNRRQWKRRFAGRLPLGSQEFLAFCLVHANVSP
jgi:Fe-S-cluster containining protein